MLLAVLVRAGGRLGGPLCSTSTGRPDHDPAGEREPARGERGSRRAGSGLPAARQSGWKDWPSPPIQGVSPCASVKCGPTLDFWRSLNELRPVFGQLILSDGNIALDLTQPATPRQREEREPAGGPAALPADPALHLRHSRHPPEPHHGTGEVRALDIAQLRWQNRGKAASGVGKAYLINGVGRAPRPHHRCGCPEVRLGPPQGPALSGGPGAGHQPHAGPDPRRRAAGEPASSTSSSGSEFEKGRLGNSLAGLWQQPPDLEGSRDQGEPHRLDLQGQDPAAPGRRGAGSSPAHDVTFQLGWRHLAAARLQLERIGITHPGLCARHRSRPDCQPEPAGLPALS